MKTISINGVEYNLVPKTCGLEKEVPEKERASNGMYIGINGSHEHYYVDLLGNVCSGNTLIYKKLSFQTQEQAKSWAAKEEALKRIWRWKTENDGYFTPNREYENEEKYYISVYDRDLIRDSQTSIQNQMLVPYYKTKDIAIRAADDLEKEYKILFGVE